MNLVYDSKVTQKENTEVFKEAISTLGIEPRKLQNSLTVAVRLEESVIVSSSFA